MQAITKLATATLALTLVLSLIPAQARRMPPNPSPAATVPVLGKDKQGQDVVAYFSAPDEAMDADNVAAPAAGGFYRVLLGKDAKGCWRFEDHFQDSGKRQSASTTCSADDLSSWSLQRAEGKMTLYRPNGQVRAETHFKDGEYHGVDRYYDDQGKVRMSIVWQHGSMHGPFKLRDLSGKRHIEGEAHKGKITRIKATDNGKALSRKAAMELLEEAQSSSWSTDMYR